MTSAAPLSGGRPEPAIKANAAPGTISPAPQPETGKTRWPRRQAKHTKRLCRWGKNAATNRRAGAQQRGIWSTKQSQAVTNSTMGRTARSRWCLWPANRRATPLVVGARVRRSPLQLCQKIALRENANRAPALSHPSGASPRLDGIGARLSGFLPLLAAPRHLLMQDNRISPSNARLKHRQEPGRVCRVVVTFIPFRVAAFHGFNHGSGDLNCPTNPLSE